MTAGLSASSQALLVASTSPVGEGQKLVAGSPELVLNVAGQSAGRRRGQDIIQTSLQGLAFAGEGSGILRQSEGPVQPQLGAGGQDIRARLIGIGDVPDEMGQAGLVRVRMALLRAIAIGTPNLGSVPVHQSPDHEGDLPPTARTSA
jgi:hypothetical protein